LRAQLEQTLAGNYTIERELGGGGMARVFVATETALARKVVIKVLSPELAAGVSQQRFAREIRLAAPLQQANIVGVLTTGEIAAERGQEAASPYYTMPFVDGLSLHEHLGRTNGLVVAEAISVLRDVARALAYAHEHGVVHRDIKPGNVLLSGASAVVTDFGIAKALDDAKRRQRPESQEKDASTADLTALGTAIGTPAYMSPEQVTADPNTDHRTDLYSFGCLAYEVFTGSSPFAGRSASQLMAAHVKERPAPLGERCPDCPPAIARVVMRCLEKDPAHRPQSAREVLSALDAASGAVTGFARFRNRLTRGQRTAALAGVGLIAVAGGVAQFRAWRNARDEVSSIAVVPFFNVAGDSAVDYLADGLAEELATALGKVHGIRVVARSASRQFKGRQDADAHAIGKALSAGHVVQGSLRRVGSRLRVSAQLTNARDNSEVWSESYDRSSSDALGLQDEIIRSILGMLRSLLGTESVPMKVSAGTSNQEASDLYMRGRLLLQRRSKGVRQSAENFAQAIAKDSNYARAHASLAVALELLPFFEYVNVDSLDKRAVLAASRALTLDSGLAEAHTALAIAHEHKYEWQLAEDLHRRAIVVGPDEPDAHIQYGRFLFDMGRVSEALPQFERARALDPLSAVASGWLGHLLDLNGRDSAAVAELTRALQIDSTNPPSLSFMAQAHLYAGRRAEARVYVERLRRVWPNWGNGGVISTSDDRERTLAALRELEATGRILVNPSPYLTLGDSARYLEALERATRARTMWPIYSSLAERSVDLVRRSARFAAIVRSAGLNESVFTSPTGGRTR
jgi:serine/threonine-protein kinase